MTITPLKINSNQNVLTDFIESLETSLDEIYKQNSNEDIAKQMFTVVHKQGIQFFDQQMFKSPPQFICLLISTFPEKYQQADSVYLIRHGRPYMRSAAAVRCLLYLKWHYKFLFPFAWIIPLPLRDIAYRIVAKYRMKFFAPPEVCIFPSFTA